MKPQHVFRSHEIKRKKGKAQTGMVNDICFLGTLLHPTAQGAKKKPSLIKTCTCTSGR